MWRALKSAPFCPQDRPEPSRPRSVGHGMFLYRGEGNQPHLVSDSRLLGGIQPATRSGAVCFQFKRRGPCAKAGIAPESQIITPFSLKAQPARLALFYFTASECCCTGTCGFVSRKRESRGRVCKPVVVRSHFLVAV